jgi:hypothetical protein
LAVFLFCADPLPAGPYAAPNVGFWVNSGQSWILASSGYGANDPKQTFN